MFVTRSKLRLLSVATLAGLVLATGTASAVPAKVANTTVIATGLQVTGPAVFVADGGHVPVTVKGKQGDTHQVFQVLDYAGNPILSVPPFGGPAVLGDNFRVFAPGQVFGQAATIWLNGSVTLGGVQSNSTSQGGVTLYSGSADPNVSPPSTLVSAAAGGNPAAYRRFVDGDRYFRSNGTDYVWLNGLWVAH